ncbi:MAG: NAD(P)H-dependent oxidoreductase subunit E [Planctomycetaceae bacterium]|jgi:NADH:ubiquinone oxidoreductase subunit E|nr:NAD(P)H-dependent oxidoreductase subunit E [Planctomycetaceae bacterium]
MSTNSNCNTKPKIVVCLGSSCFARGNSEIIRVIEEYLAKNNCHDEIDIEISGSLCQECCADGPNVLVNGTIHNNVDSGVLLDILKNLLPEQNHTQNQNNNLSQQ